MLDLRFVAEHLDIVKTKTAQRQVAFDFAPLEQLEEARRRAIRDYETVRAEQKRASDGMKALKPGSPEFDALRATLKEMADRGKAL